MAFDAIIKLAEGVPDYLEVPVEAGLLLMRRLRTWLPSLC